MEILFFIVIGILFVLGTLSIISGFFTSVRIKEKVMGPFKLVFKEHVGSYKETGKIQDEIYNKLLNEENIETYRGFGIYYDDPQDTPQNELRSKSGCILEEKDYDKIHKLDDSYNLMELEKQKFIYTEFPFKSKISIIMGTFKVYPKIEKYVEEKSYKKREVMEIYDVPNKKIFI